MSSRRSRNVRKAPLAERLQAYFNPGDWLLYLSEEIQTSDWAKVQGPQTLLIGLGVNLAYIVALSNSKSADAYADDVFGDYTTRAGSGWWRAFCWLVEWLLVMASVANAFMAFASARRYRLFERTIDDLPSTPSAKRVRVDDSPVVQTPLNFLKEKFNFGSAESRAHPDSARDVVELSIWDPPPLCVRLFTLFSPAHIFIYRLFLPTQALDPTPSYTIFKSMLMCCLVSAQSFGLEHKFTQQAADKLILNHEVLHEYDTKYVHPSINRPARDVGIQTPPLKTSRRLSGTAALSTDTGTDPMDTGPEVVASPEYTIINRGFRTNPNPAYATHFDKDNILGLQSAAAKRPALFSTPSMERPRSSYASAATSIPASHFNDTGFPSSPLTQPGPHDVQTRYNNRPYKSVATDSHAGPGPGASAKPRTTARTAGDGGSLGVFTSAHSPLRKAASSEQMRRVNANSALDRLRREGSPLKRMSLPHAPQGDLGPPSPGLGANPNPRSRDSGREEQPGRRQSGR